MLRGASVFDPLPRPPACDAREAPARPSTSPLLSDVVLAVLRDAVPRGRPPRPPPPPPIVSSAAVRELLLDRFALDDPCPRRAMCCASRSVEHSSEWYHTGKRLERLSRRIEELVNMREELRVLLAEWDATLPKTADGQPARLLETLGSKSVIDQRRGDRRAISQGRRPDAAK